MDDNNANAAFIRPTNNCVTIRIKNRDYAVSSHFSLNDGEVLLSLLEQDDEKSAIIKIIQSKIAECGQEAPMLEEMRCEDESAFVPFFLAVIDNCQELKDCYNEMESSTSPCKRFVMSCQHYYESWLERLNASTKPLLDTFDRINKSVDLSWINQIQNMLRIYQPMFMEAAQIAHRAAEVISPALIRAAEVAQEISAALAPIQNTILEYAQAISEITANIRIPTITDDDRKRLEGNYEKWGKLGWTIIPSAPIKLFNSDPTSIDDAHKMAMKFCSTKDMEELFAQLRTQKIKQADLESAIFCYKNQQYKACALLLFGLLDAKLIRKQPKREGGKRPSGNRAVKKIKDKFEAEHSIEDLFFLALDYINLMTCLDTFFADGNDFVNEPSVINRNYVNHGMNARRVRKRDCIQLFLVLHNLLSFMEHL